MNSLLSSFVVDCFQSKRAAGVNATIRAVPTGLSEIEFYQYGLEAKSPLDAAVVLPADLKFAAERFRGFEALVKS